MGVEFELVGRPFTILGPARERAEDMRGMLAGDLTVGKGRRAIALIDPTRRRREWLTPSRVDGRRRTAAPFRDYRDAVDRLMARSSQPR
jgi:hypothetical protein